MNEEKLNSKYLIDEHPITFHPTLALAIGVNEAILLQKINLWLNCKPHNADGRNWIYNTYKSWKEQLPFWSESTIKRIIKNLFDIGIIIKGNFNKSKFDKTVWYSIDYDKLDTIVDQKTQNYRLGQFDTTMVSSWTNRECQSDTTYTNDYTMITNNDNIYSQNYSDGQLLTNYNDKVSNDTNTGKKDEEVSDDTLHLISEIIKYLNDKLKTKYRPTSANTQKHIKARLKEGFTLDDFKSVIDKKYNEWNNTKFQVYLRPETLFGTKFESYLNTSVNRNNTFNNTTRRYERIETNESWN